MQTIEQGFQDFSTVTGRLERIDLPFLVSAHLTSGGEPFWPGGTLCFVNVPLLAEPELCARIATEQPTCGPLDAPVPATLITGCPPP